MRSGGSRINSREEAFVVRALVELLDTIDASHGGEVTERDLVGADADHGPVLFEKLLHGPALLHAQHVCRDPEVGDGGIPRTGDGGERREEDSVDGGSGDIAHGEGYRKEDYVCCAERERRGGVDRECCGERGRDRSRTGGHRGLA